MRTNVGVGGAVIALVLALADPAASGWGLKGGLSCAEQDFDPSVSGIEERTGLHAALCLTLFGVGPLRLGAELAYTQRGTTYVGSGWTDGSRGRGEEHDNRLDYLSLSLLGQWDLGAGPIVPFVAAGPRADVLIGDDVYEAFEDIYEGSDSVDVGGDVAAGLRVLNVTLEGRYSMVFGDSFTEGEFDVRNSAVLLLVGIEF